MPIVDSRLKTGTLTLDAVPFAKQASTVSLVPSFAEEGERIETLSGDKIEPDEVTSWSLNIGLVQDFTDPDGLVEWLRANGGTVVPFSWKPNGTGPTYSGDLRVRPTTIGGGVNVRLTSDVELPVTEIDDPTYPTP